jgi:hypothetical protein
MMKRHHEMRNQAHRTRGRSIIHALAFAIALSFTSVSSAAPTGKTFSSPEKAVEAAIAAFRDYSPKAVGAVFGKGSGSLFESADPVQDENVRVRFLELFDAGHELSPAGADTFLLIVGPDAWPFPIPIVKTKKGWAFDTAAGSEEIIDRRIGRNELRTIQACLAVVDAQRDYYRRDRDGDGILEFAQKLVSTVGLHDGLFWHADEGAPPSPLGAVYAEAAAEGYTRTTGSYHGYKFRLLHEQGPAARGGAYGYVARDNQIGGFALLAFPAEWGDSGIMTFIVNHDGIVYQRDLGPETTTEAAKIEAFDPGEGWILVADQDLEPIPPE